MDKERKGTISPYRIIEYYSTGKDVVIGTIYGHPWFPDGGPIRTSYIVKVDEEAKEVETRNSIYKLGEKSEKI